MLFETVLLLMLFETVKTMSDEASLSAIHFYDWKVFSYESQVTLLTYFVKQ